MDVSATLSPCEKAAREFSKQLFPGEAWPVYPHWAKGPQGACYRLALAAFMLYKDEWEGARFKTCDWKWPFDTLRAEGAAGFAGRDEPWSVLFRRAVEIAQEDKK